MEAKFDDTPEAIKPIYSTKNINEEIILYIGDLQLILVSGKVIKSEGIIYYSWLPSPQISFSIPELPKYIKFDDSNQLIIPGINFPINIIITSISINEHHPISGVFSEPIVIKPSKQCNKIIAHIANFSQFYGEPIQQKDKGTGWLGRMSFTNNIWEINLDQLKETAEMIQVLKKQGGYGITHVIQLKKFDNSYFNIDEAQKILRDFGYFLSFLQGRWTSPILSIGYDQDRKTCQEWKASRIHDWKYVDNWFPWFRHEDVKNINQIFVSFMCKCEDPDWRDAIIIAIHWYVDANISESSAEGIVVAVASALELLGWKYLISNNYITPEKFNKSPAANNLELLLTKLNIPTCIPNECMNLQSTQKDSGPKAFIHIRNRIIHPPSRNEQEFITNYPHMARVEAKELGLWYLEMVLLAILDYQGYYSNRFSKGYIDDARMLVPWAKENCHE